MGGREGQPRGQNGPGWWAGKLGSGNRELGGVQYADLEATSGQGKMWVPRRGPRGARKARAEDTGCAWVWMLSVP